jgi:hypothetical protein
MIYEVDISKKAQLQSMIDKAWQDFSEIAKAEEEDDYSDAMVSMERTEANGYAEGLSSAYRLIFGEGYIPQEITDGDA